ncbi:MAG: hypothetical protein V4651_04770 [Bacteroidota bacterium]
MKQLSLIIFFLLFFNAAQSQGIKSYEYIGTLQLSSKQLITYKISLTEISPGIIEGTSITDIYGKNRTQSVIRGTYNPKANKISFYETKNISSKSTTNKDEFCYVHVSDAGIKSVGGKTILQGSFTGNYLDGKICAKGLIYLIATKDLEALSNEMLTPETIKNEDSLKLIKDKVNNMLSKKENSYLRGNDVLSVNSTAKELTIEIWDGGEEEDNDAISILVNNKIFIDKIDIKKERKTITIPIGEGTSQIKIVALSEGKSHPCTANILVKDEINSSPIVTVLKKGEFAIVEIKK